MSKIKYLGARINNPKIKAPERAKVFCFSNQKGGVGKSTSSQVMCDALSLVGYKVLALDLDIQNNFTRSADADDNGSSALLSHAFQYIAEGNVVTKEIVHMMINTTNGGYDIISADANMISADRTYGNVENSDLFIKQIVDAVRDEYHFIIIDTQPNLYMLTRNAYCAADELLIPMQPNSSSTDGLGLLLLLYDELKKSYNLDLSINGVFFTMVEDGANPRDTILGMFDIAESLGVRVMTSFIKKAKIYDNLKDKHVTMQTQILKNPQMAQYLLLINEILGQKLFVLMTEEY